MHSKTFQHHLGRRVFPAVTMRGWVCIGATVACVAIWSAIGAAVFG